jgi:hypothetical protein
MMQESFKIIGTRFIKRMENVSEIERKEMIKALDLLEHKVFYQIN